MRFSQPISLMLLSFLCLPLTAFTVRAAAPQIAFQVKNGWVEMTLTQDHEPISEAEVRIITPNGQVFAEGETTAAGRGEFPLPPGTYFRVELKLAARTADPIQLTRIDDSVVPNRVLLSFGLAPCCKVPSRESLSGVTSDDDRATGPTNIIPIAWIPISIMIIVTIGCVRLLRKNRLHLSKVSS